MAAPFFQWVFFFKNTIHDTQCFLQWRQVTNTDFYFLSVQSEIYSVQISLQVFQDFSRQLPRASLENKSLRDCGKALGDIWDRLWKSRRGYLEKVPPWENLKPRDVPKANASEEPKGLTSEYPEAFRFSRGGTIFRYHPRLFHNLWDFCFPEVQGHSP